MTVSCEAGVGGSWSRTESGATVSSLDFSLRTISGPSLVSLVNGVETSVVCSPWENMDDSAEVAGVYTSGTAAWLLEAWVPTLALRECERSREERGMGRGP